MMHKKNNSLHVKQKLLHPPYQILDSWLSKMHKRKEWPLLRARDERDTFTFFLGNLPRFLHLCCLPLVGIPLPGVEGVLSYMGYIGMCHCEGYSIGSGIGYINQRVWV